MAEKENPNKMLMRYAGLAMQFFVAIGLGVFAGLNLDEWLGFSIPLLVWLLPLFMIIGMIVKILFETNKKNAKK